MLYDDYDNKHTHIDHALLPERHIKVALLQLLFVLLQLQTAIADQVCAYNQQTWYARSLSPIISG